MSSEARSLKITNILGLATASEDSASAFDEFYRKHSGFVRNLLYRMGLRSELDDAMQDSFVKAWKGQKNFDGRSSEKTWLARITVNTALDYLRKRNRDPHNFGFDPDQVSSVGRSPDEALVEQALQSLKQEHRFVLVLSAIEGFTNAEIATMLSIPVGTVKSRLYHARQECEKALRRLGVSL